MFSLAGIAWAEDETDPDDKELEEALGNLGLSAGYALQCADKAMQETIAKQVFRGGDLLITDEGSHAAFLFMIYFGVGSKEEIDKEKCTEYLDDWKNIVDENKLI